MAPRPSRDGAVTDAELPALFAPFAGAGRLGLAVSGGPDSTALLLLAHRWAGTAANRPAVTVFTVDHGLRATSAGEADAVAALAARLGLAWEILVWRHDGPPPAADLQAAAREARYGLLADAAARAGVGTVLLAHTLDDVAETLLMRLARGSGVRGLAAMPAERRIRGIRFARPLLSVPKARLVATVAAAGIPSVDDPSNAADRFLRARVRRIMPLLADLGLTADRLAGTARRLARAADAVDVMVADLAARAATDHGGVVSVACPALHEAPEEVALRLVASLVRTVRPAAYLPRAAPLEDFVAAVRAAGTAPRRTVAGVVLDARGDRIWLYAESGRRGFPAVPIHGPGTTVWDDRIAVEVEGPVAPGARIVAGANRDDLPRAAAASLPRVEGVATSGVKLRPIGRFPTTEATDD